MGGGEGEADDDDEREACECEIRRTPTGEAPCPSDEIRGPHGPGCECGNDERVDIESLVLSTRLWEGLATELVG